LTKGELPYTIPTVGDSTAIDLASQKRDNSVSEYRVQPMSPKPLKWVGSSRESLGRFPGPVRREFGYALYLAQLGMSGLNVKALKGFGGAGVLQVVASHHGDTYRVVYTVAFAKAVFVLHAFQKKSKRGSTTPRKEIELIRSRLAVAERAYCELYEGK
jgi:phage-related protein